ncbi:MAG: heme A synthase [Gammaproteobacteria bacterium]|jgi:cytochrome c oxidase assembly protein subunit 15|nr:heme A synthase [Gammaproteobacteria bacterium]
MNSLPETRTRDRAIATWLLICCGFVFAMVVLGGFTRLTGSGLSIAEWRPIMGTLPPLSDAEWQRVFEIYKQTPEFQTVNSHMDVHDFKGIFWLEYLHRLLGRLLGLAFLLPLIYFVARKYITMRQLPWYLLMFALGGMQAVIGKVMVASGQVDAPQVSHYRLTAHLSAAFLVYALMFWRALSLLHGLSPGASHPWYRRTVALTALIAVTIVSGGFVAGLDAGLIYNTFPKMGDYWIPPGLFALDPAWRNVFDNLTTVQFDHRLLALATFALIAAYWLRARSAEFPRRARAGANALLVTAVLQVLLGITTVVLAVPTLPAVGHQGTALLLLTSALYLSHGLRRG